MRKRVIYLGVLFIFLSVVALAASSLNLQNPLGQDIYGIANLTFKNQTVGNSSFDSIAINLNSTSTLIFSTKSYNRSNIYIMNTSAFLNWVNGSYNEGFNGVAKALELKDKGIIAIYHNVLSAIFPTGMVPNATNATYVPEYESSYAINGTLPAGSYYIVIDNTNGSASYSHALPVSLQYLHYPLTAPLSLLKGNSPLSSFLLTSSISVLLFVMGFALIIVGIITKTKDRKMIVEGKLVTVHRTKASAMPSSASIGDNISDEQLDKLYKGVEAKHVRRSRRKSRKSRPYVKGPKA